MSEIKDRIQGAIVRSDPKQLRECFYILKSLILEGQHFQSEDFDFFISLLKNESFLKLGGGWYFVMVFSLDCDRFPFHESEKVASAISVAYDALEEFLPELIPEAIEAAIHSGQEIQMEECASAISSAISRYNFFPSLYFNLILDLLKENSFLNAKGSHHLLFAIDTSNWEIISEQQKTELLPLLENSYSLFADWMSCFIITELLGQYYANEVALNILCRLKKTEAETPRSLIPHGFQHFVTDSDDPKLVKKAYEELLQMKEDSSEKVRDEVHEHLRIVANRGKIPY